LIAHDKGVSALIQPDRGDRQALMMLELALLLGAVLVTQRDAFGKQFIATLNALHTQYQPT
jgi:hypothetical protein